MPASTDTGAQLNLAERGKEIYDAIMGEIDPELTSAQASILAEKYKGESEEEHKLRMARYGKAFAVYETAYVEFLRMFDAEIRACVRKVRAQAEGRERAEEEAMSHQLLAAMEAA